MAIAIGLGLTLIAVGIQQGLAAIAEAIRIFSYQSNNKDTKK